MVKRSLHRWINLVHLSSGILKVAKEKQCINFGKKNAGMKFMTIQVPDDSVDFVEEFVERIGGSVETKEEKKESKKTSVKKAANKNRKEEIDHTFMFGKWKDYDIDPKKLREEVWQRKFE